MGEPFIGEIKMVGFTYAPRGWADCHGQLMDINQNQALFALIFNQFGGDGRSNFGLPDLRGRVPVHPGGYLSQGDAGGMEEVRITEAELPEHTHGVKGSTQNADTRTGGKSTEAFAKSEMPIYGDPKNLVELHPQAVTVADGSDLPHSNMQPSQVIRYVIALQGIFPSRS